MDIKSDSNFNFICSAPTPWEKGRLFLASGKCKNDLFQIFCSTINEKPRLWNAIKEICTFIDVPLSTFLYGTQKRQKQTKHTQNYVALRKDVINMCRRPEIRTCTACTTCSVLNRKNEGRILFNKTINFSRLHFVLQFRFCVTFHNNLKIVSSQKNIPAKCN